MNLNFFKFTARHVLIEIIRILMPQKMLLFDENEQIIKLEPKEFR